MAVGWYGWIKDMELGWYGWIVDMELGWYGWNIDMDLGWLVLVANMKMSMCVCVFFFTKMVPMTYREEHASCLQPLHMAIAANILAFQFLVAVQFTGQIF